MMAAASMFYPEDTIGAHAHEQLRSWGLSLPELEDKQGPDLPRVILSPVDMTLE
jgi:hypothetical protein